MTEELLKKINNDNYNIINELVNIIVNNKINDLEELKKYQDSLFTINGKVLNHNEQLDYCKRIIISDSYVKEDIDFIDLQKVLKLKEELNEALDSKKIIELMSLLDKTMLLPYDAYNMIMNN